MICIQKNEEMLRLSSEGSQMRADAEDYASLTASCSSCSRQ